MYFMDIITKVYNNEEVWEITLDPLATWLDKRVLRFDKETYTKAEAIKHAQCYPSSLFD